VGWVDIPRHTLGGTPHHGPTPTASLKALGATGGSAADYPQNGPNPDAQREVLVRFAAAEGFELAHVFIEVETGKGADALNRRPQLVAALAEARRRRCAVAVAKLDV
jgi:hypothetical protein